ncbi:hypothetical protein [Gordonia sp. VNK21]|uniref:hypothetical protein n=1 Tax=Gordonia sp. VNK21 TaxID=3382483 RepID=UPI0038D3ED13
MSDQYEYVDENGDPIDPSELGDDVEFVDEEFEEVVEDTPAAAEPVVPTSEPVSAPTAAAGPAAKVPKALLAGVAAAVLLLGGGAAYALSQLGNQDSVEQVKAAATKKTEELKDEARADIDACDGRQVAAASYGKGGGDKPKMQLKVTSVTALPPGYAERVEGLGDRAADRVTILQQSTGDLGVYVQEEATKDERTGRKKAGWWKVSASTDDRGARVLGEEQGTGEDVDAATACKTVKGGVYAVTGDDVPEAARGMRDGQVVVDSLKPDGAIAEVVWLVMGDQLARSVLEYAPAQESEAGDAEETTTATTTTEKGR